MTSHRREQSASRPPPPGQTAGDLVATVQRLAPLIAEHREAIDRERRLPQPLFAALAEAGLFRLWLPRAIGGPQLSPVEFMEVVEAAAALDGSVGWLVGNGGGMSRAGGYLPETVVRDWFGDRHAFIVAATGAVGDAVPVEGGYRVTGRWPFGSGAHHATRFMGLCRVADGANEAAPASICCYVPRDAVEIIDTWHVSGLRGTGSCDFTMRDVFVPTDHTHAFPGHQATQPGLLYRMPAMSVFAWTVSVVPLGIARAATSSFISHAGHKTRLGTTSSLREREIVQSDVGRAEAMLRAARGLLVAAMEELMAATDCGGERLIAARAHLRVAGAHAAETAVRVVDMMAAAAGAASIFETSALERCLRDVHAAVRHVAMSPASYIVAGRLHLGLDVSTQRF